MKLIGCIYKNVMKKLASYKCSIVVLLIIRVLICHHIDKIIFVLKINIHLFSLFECLYVNLTDNHPLIDRD
jgi:hypothetical protein